MGLGEVRPREVKANVPMEESDNNTLSPFLVINWVEPPRSQHPLDQSQADGDDQLHGIDQGGEQGGAAQVDAPQVEDDDDGSIQPQSQVPHPTVHQSI